MTEKSDLLYKRFLDAECQFLLCVREKKAKTNMFGIVEIGGALTELLYYAGRKSTLYFLRGNRQTSAASLPVKMQQKS